jgi:hypothetical protein
MAIAPVDDVDEKVDFDPEPVAGEGITLGEKREAAGRQPPVWL